MVLLGGRVVRVPVKPILAAAIEQACFGEAQHQSKLLLKLVWKPDVVRVKEGQETAAGMANAEVARCSEAAVHVTGMLKVDNLPGVLADILLSDGGAAVCRAVVDKQQLPVGAGLGEHAFDRLGEKCIAVEKRDDDGDEVAWLIHGRSHAAGFNALIPRMSS